MAERKEGKGEDEKQEKKKWQETWEELDPRNVCEGFTSMVKQGNQRWQTSPQCHTLTNSTKHCSCLTSNSYRHLANSCKQNAVLDYGPLAPCHENMTSSAKPKVQRVSQKQATATGNLHKN